MKVRITILTENDVPFENLGVSKERFEELCKQSWQLALTNLLTLSKDPSEKAVVEKCELVEEA